MPERPSAASDLEEDLADFFDNAALPLHWVDRDGVIVRVNQAELDMLGYPREEYLGRNIAQFHVDAGAIKDILQRLSAGETLREYPARLRCKDGTTRDVRITSNVRRRDGEFLHTRCLTRDATAENAARDRDEARAHLAAIVESSDDAIVSKSLEGIIQSWNRGAERLFGYRAAEVVGRSIALIIPEERLHEERQFLLRLRAGERIEHFETVRRRKDGRMVDVSLTISPVRDLTGRIIGASKIARDISSRRRFEEAQREADRRKDEFLAMLAHELRNPLAPIRSSLDVLRLAPPGSEAADKARTIIERQVKQLVRLVDDLLEVSRASRGKIDLAREALDLAGVVANAMETSRPAIEAARHKLSVTVPAEPLIVNGDPVRLGQVIANLLNNSAKYTDPGGEIAVSLRAEGREAVLEVRDNGIGIEADMLPIVFEMFTQLGRGMGRASGGLGIGLALAHKLVGLHGGRIEAASDGPGKGAVFTVRLPLVNSVPRPAPAEPPPWAAIERGRARRILLVDDNVDAAQALGMMLTSLGHDVQLAHDGHAALEAARGRRPDVALLDISMPGIDGNEVLRRLRQQPEFRAVRFIAITGLGRPEDIRRSKEAGFDEHLVKPVSPDVLRLVLDQG